MTTTETLVPPHSIAIDEEGYALSGDTRVTDAFVGREVLEHLALAKNGAYVSRFGGTPVLVEAFNEPLVVQQINRDDGEWTMILPYGHQESFDPSRLFVDEWDRFHGTNANGVPFVFSNKAQAAFFNAVDEFDDDSVTIDGRQIPIPPTYGSTTAMTSPNEWTQTYESEGQPGWDLAGPAEALKDMLPRLKLAKQRVLVVGCGEGHDAAFFANDGHIVTAVDFSPEAIRRAQAHYGALTNLKFLTADLFALDRSHDGAYDIVFDHTLYCAIPPERRRELVTRWWRWLAPGGHLMGIFFATEKRQGPPYGGTEWELRERLKANFRFIFWGRWKKSIPRRQGRELFVYAGKIGG